MSAAPGPDRPARGAVPARAARPARRALAVALALAACAAAGCANAAPAPDDQPPILEPRLGPPRVDGGRVNWTPEPDSASGVAAPPPAPDDSARAGWLLARARDPRLTAWALHELAPLRLARGDTLGADSCWAALAADPGVWQWEAVRSRADLAHARDGDAAADAMLGAAPGDWPELERSAWWSRRAVLRAALGDTVAALAACRHATRMDPSFPPAGTALDLMARLLAARGEAMGADDERAAAAIERARGNRGEAIHHLEHARALEPRRPAGGLALAAELRAARRRSEAWRVLEATCGDSIANSAGCLLERARQQRAAGHVRDALADCRAVAAADPGGALAETAWWEAAREAESRDRIAEAREAYMEVVSLGRRREGEAALRLGILWMADGRAGIARAWFARAGGEAGAFWSAVAMRALDRATPDSAASASADSLLRALAARPGYGFYRAAARDTLGLRGWPGAVAPGGCAPGACPALDRARALLAVGARDEALLVVARWAARDTARDGDARLDAARIAYAAGRPRTAIGYALDAADALPEARAWSAVPWAYPAAHDSLYRAIHEEPEVGFDRALLRAVTWQESRFDHEARSRNNAIGLMQLKIPAATDVARWRREPAPHEGDLEDPELNLRYGAHYLQSLLRRFDGNVAAALGAYNAGAARVPDRWKTVIERGGEALLAELMPFDETRTYVNRVMAARAAYRDLMPFARP